MTSESVTLQDDVVNGKSHGGFSKVVFALISVGGIGEKFERPVWGG